MKSERKFTIMIIVNFRSNFIEIWKRTQSTLRQQVEAELADSRLALTKAFAVTKASLSSLLAFFHAPDAPPPLASQAREEADMPSVNGIPGHSVAAGPEVDEPRSDRT